MIFALEVEMRNTVNTAALVAAHWDIECLCAEAPGGRDVFRHEEFAHPLPDFSGSGKLLHYGNHLGVGRPSHTLECVHAVDVRPHAAVTECACDHRLGVGMGITDECG